MEPVIAVEDPCAPDVVALLEVHLAFNHDVTPAGHVHALDLDGLTDPSVSFFTARDPGDGTLVGVAALKALDDHHAELKSMHTIAARRGTGVGRRVVDHLVAHARAHGFDRISLETGNTDAYAPARSLYAAAGFVPCGPFAAYVADHHSAFLTLDLTGRA